MMGLGRLIRSVTNSRRKRNYKKSKDLIETKTKQKKDKKKNYSSLCTPQIQWSPVEGSRAQDFSNYVVWHRIKRTVRYPKWKHVEVELSKIEKIMTGLAPHRDYPFCISIFSKTRGMGIRSPATSVRTSDGNCECFLLERGGRRDGTFSESLNGMVLVRP